MRFAPALPWRMAVPSLLVVLAACSASPTGSPVTVSVPGAETVSPACRAAVRLAAAIPDGEDRVTDLDDAIRSCQTAEEWSIATSMFPAALDGGDAATFLNARCELPGLAALPLCRGRAR